MNKDKAHFEIYFHVSFIVMSKLTRHDHNYDTFICIENYGNFKRSGFIITNIANIYRAILL